MGRPSIVLVVALVVALVTAGCSGGDGGSREPIVVGFINMEGSPQGSFPEIRTAAEAAVRYLNEQRKGVGGRPIALETCITDGSAESSRTCATELVRKGPVAILGGIDLGTDGSMPVFEEIRIPYLGLTPGLGSELTSFSSFMLAGGLAADLLAQVEYVTGTLRATKVGVVHQDFPGLQSAAVLAAQAILQKRGVTDLKVVPVKPEVTDLAPAVRAATAANPDVLLAVFPAQGCRRLLAATQPLRVRARLFLPSSCLDEGLLAEVGAAAEGVTLASSLLPYTDTANADVATYLQHAPTPHSALSQAGFALVMNLHRLLSGLDKSEVTAVALTDKVRAAREVPSFMGHRYSCDGQQITLLPSACNTWVRLVQVSDGGLRDVTGDWLNGAGLVKLLTG